MNKKIITDAATAYAKDQLGEEQFKKNKDAVKALETDFKDGAQFCFENIGEIVGSPALQLLLVERMEQIHKHKRTLEHDKTVNPNGELLQAAKAMIDENEMFPTAWVANKDALVKMCDKPLKERLIYAAAFLLAEADRVSE